MGNQAKLLTHEAFKGIAVDSIDETCRLAGPCQKLRVMGIGHLGIVYCFTGEVVIAGNQIERTVALLNGTCCGFV
ncbi:hypothetical protein CYL20_09615 [Pseudomonas palleroniana]|uniref:Uncharacterized protein n=1 Tax=Pseudomonas palleroniana TaxID=191390 RepID=A0A2L1J8J8_9PSED|nr:hypothetical protein CYL20_09615 [Pseudomonas palleroniana]